jgi:hypothetical protein
MPQNLFPSFFAGSRRHHAHHKVGSVYFQKFFRYLDDPYNWLRKRWGQMQRQRQMQGQMQVSAA